MKLLQYTNRKLTLLLLFLIGIWGIFFYFAIQHEIMDETDDMLQSYRDIFVKKALHDSTLLNSSYETTFDRYSIHPISDEEAEKYEEKWFNTEVYFPEDDEHIPVRVFKSIFLAADHNYYELEISMSTMERDDMTETLLVYLLSLYAILLVCILVGNWIILRKSFKPLTKLLDWLNSIVPGKEIPELENDTDILEFKKLNDASVAMSRRNLQVYEQQKQFTENASHELQTPLAVVMNKIELLSQDSALTEKQLSEIDEIYRTLNNASKLNKSLLLLSRIENQQFTEEKEINLNSLIKELVDELMEIYADKNLLLKIHEEAQCTIFINETLSQMLISNLLKNAFVHTPKNGYITIIVDKESLTIKNSGGTALNEKKIFQRFYHSAGKSVSGSTGLGLAIVKSICDNSGLEIQYRFQQEHIFMLKFRK